MRYRLVAVSQEHPEGGSLTVERKSSEPSKFRSFYWRGVRSLQPRLPSADRSDIRSIAESLATLHAIIVES